MTTEFLKTRTGGPGFLEETTVETSAGAGDANKIPSLDSSGRLTNSVMPTGVGQASFAAEATEALSAGDFVNIWDDAGNLEVRLADNSNGREANGFVDAAYTAGQTATVFYGDQNANLSSLTLGAHYYLGTAGNVTSTQPTTAGSLVQYLGKAISATSLQVEIALPIELAP